MSQNDSCTVSEHCAPVRNQQEVDCDSKDEQVSSRARRGLRIIYVRSTSVQTCEQEIELTSSRHVKVTAWLVSTGVQAEVNHNSAGILGSNNVVTTIRVRLVISEELIINLLVDIDTVSLNLNGLQSLDALRVNKVALANLRSLSISARKSVSTNQIRCDHKTVTSADVTSKTLRLHRARNSLINQTGKTIPITPEVNVTGSNSQTADSGLSDVELGSHTSIQGLNGPLKVAQENAVRRNLLFLSLESVNSDERETNSLNVNIVNLRVNEDVVNVKLALVDVGGNNTRIAARKLHGAQCSIASIRSNSSTGAGTIRVGNNLSGQSQRNITSGGGNNIINTSKINSNESLTIRNRNGSNRQTGILVEPEQKRNPPILNGLSGLRSLRAVDDEAHLTGVVRGVDGRALSGSTIDIKKTNSGSTVGRSTADSGKASESLNRNFLTNKALPTSKLTRGNTELLVEHNGFGSVLIKRVSVNLKLNLGEEAFTRVFNITNVVLASGGSSIKNSALKVDVVVCVSCVRVSDGGIFRSAHRVSGSYRLIRCTNMSGEGRKASNSARRSSGNLCVDNHVVEEISKLGNGESDRLAETGSTTVREHFIVLIPDGGAISPFESFYALCIIIQNP